MAAGLCDSSGGTSGQAREAIARASDVSREVVRLATGPPRGQGRVGWGRVVVVVMVVVVVLVIEVVVVVVVVVVIVVVVVVVIAAVLVAVVYYY